ncbi:MAG: endolytic transglycosylase MltG [Pseudomonadales bacterium]
MGEKGRGGLSLTWRYLAVRATALAVLLGLTVWVAWTEINHWRHDPEALRGSVTVVLARGESLKEFAGKLAEAGVLSRPRLWQLLARLDPDQSFIKAGEYRLSDQDTPATLLARLRAHDVVRHRITLIEGWTLREVLGALARHPIVRQTLGADARQALGLALNLPRENPEGLFFPDTYVFERGASDLDILRRAHDRMNAVLARAWAQRQPDLPLKDPYGALILASIIEKETGRAEDRGFVAQVFVNRLRLGMRLQTDPTVIYGLGDRFDGDLTRAHLAEDTPYNTYRRAGLPPTPIAMPGLASLEAALAPPAGDLLYFVSRGDGTTAFSSTLDAHNRAVREFQLR